MIIIECPYCNEDINITFRDEISDLIRIGESGCKCSHCQRKFKVSLGDIKAKKIRNVSFIWR